MLGAYSVFKKIVDESANEYENKSLIRAFEEFRNMETNGILTLLSKEWGRVVTLNNLLYLLLWPKLTEYKIRSIVAAKYNNYSNLAKRL